MGEYGLYVECVKDYDRNKKYNILREIVLR